MSRVTVNNLAGASITISRYYTRWGCAGETETLAYCVGGLS